jgi:hypothetical protein
MPVLKRLNTLTGTLRKCFRSVKNLFSVRRLACRCPKNQASGRANLALLTDSGVSENISNIQAVEYRDCPALCRPIPLLFARQPPVFATVRVGLIGNLVRLHVAISG